jgi:drug/metabolite transporter (DMT)-like permease
MKTRGWLAFVSVCAIWGTSWIATGTIAGHIPPFYASAARSLLSVILLVPVILCKRIEWPRGRALRATLILSITMIVLPAGLLLWAEGHLSSATSAILFAATPLFTASLMPGFEGRQAPPQAMTAMLLGMAGIAVAVDGGFSLAQTGGAAAVLLAVLSIAASAIYAKQELRNTNPLASTAFLFAGATAFFALASLGTERGQPVEWSFSTIGSLAFMGGLSDAVGFSLYLWLLKKQEAYQVVAVKWCEPLVGMFEVALLWHEPVSRARFVGAALVVGSLVVVMRARVSSGDPMKYVVMQ